MSDKRQPDAARIGAIGVLCGIAAWAFVHIAMLLGVPSLTLPVRGTEIVLSPLSTIPGLLFGAVFAVLFRQRGKIPGGRKLGYIAAAALAYFVAFQIADNSYLRWLVDIDPAAIRLAASGVLAGIAGSCLLGIMTMWLLPAPARVVLLHSVPMGGLAGIVLAFIDFDHTDWSWSILLLFVVWQGSYAACLAPALRSPAP
jgi:hypothetical protein